MGDKEACVQLSISRSRAFRTTSTGQFRVARKRLTRVDGEWALRHGLISIGKCSPDLSVWCLKTFDILINK